MAREMPLLLTDSATLDAAGAGSVKFTVPNYDESWRVELVSVTVSTAVEEPVARVYQDGRFIDGTYTGSLDSSALNLLLQQGNYIECVWSGGDVGATATFTIQGTKRVA